VGARHKSSARPTLEALECRELPAMFMVKTTADSGTGSLRQAIVDSNGAAGPNSIDFAIGTGPQTIIVLSTLPAITTQVTIDGTTQPGFGSSPLIALIADKNPLNTGTDASGLDLRANGCVIKGLAIGGIWMNAILIESNNNTIQGNFIGTNATGTASAGGVDGINLGFTQLTPPTNVTGNTIGGTTNDARNVISGSIEGISLGGSQNLIEGNLIGTDPTGTMAVGNTTGIQGNASGNTIGGTVLGAGNVVSGNTGAGLKLSGGGSGAVIQGNRIGTNLAGNAALPNRKDGLDVLLGGQNNTFGGTTVGAGNVISGNVGVGFLLTGGNDLVAGNFIGTDIAGTVAIPNGGDGFQVQDSFGNTIEGNVISGNAGNGVKLLSTGTAAIASGSVFTNNSIGTNAAGSVAIPNQGDGINVFGVTSTTIGGTITGTGNVISGNGVSGIAVLFNPLTAAKADNTVIEGNMIGTDLGGTVAIPNGVHGIFLSGAANNTIGGTLASAGNTIGSNGQFGIFLQGFPIQSSFQAATNNVIEGNHIGSGTFGGPLGNKFGGVTLFPGATSNTIGGTTASAANVISGNLTGVILSGTGTTGNLIEGNFIGTNAAGTVAAGNLDGVLLSAGASGNTIGGTATGSGNTISGNARFGILFQDAATSGNVILGNHIGVSLSGTTALANGANGVNLNAASGNTIGGTVGGSGNTISGNAFFGILFSGGTPSNNVVEGNVIGTNAAGTAALANGMDGIDLAGAPDNTIGGPGTAGNVISGNAAFGVYLTGSGATGNQVLGNLIGSNGGGNAALPNGLYGVLIAEGANSNVIGGQLVGQRNLISGNTDFGVYLLGTGTTANVLQGNLIGVNLAGTAALANGVEGLEVLGGASGNTIGGTATGAGNVLSGNGRNGILIAQAGSNNNLVQGNFIGTDRSGTLLLGNGYQGIGLVEGAASNTVGGTVSGAANTIAFNTSTGVTVGTAASDTAAVGNAILGNSIHTNGGVDGLGIDLGNDSVTANGSGPSGPNHFQNHPTFSDGGLLGNNDVTATVSFTSVPSSTFRLEFFLNLTSDVTSQGHTFLGAVSVTTDTNGHIATATALTAGVTVGSVNTGANTVPVTLPLPANIIAGDLTATATVLSVGNGQTASVGDTSEFSATAAFGP
jgi:hypothetical protein